MTKKGKPGPKKGQRRKYASDAEAYAAKLERNREWQRRQRSLNTLGNAAPGKSPVRDPETDLQLELEARFTLHLPLRQLHSILNDAGWTLYRKPNVHKKP